MNRTHLLNKGLLKFGQLIKPFFNSMMVKNRFFVGLSQSIPKKYSPQFISFLIIGMLGINNAMLAQHNAPVFSAVSYSFCEGDNLVFTLDGLPDPSVFPGGDAALQITWYLSTSGPGTCGTADVTDVESVTLTSTSHTFNTDHILSYPVEDNSLLMITTSIIDPLNAELMRDFIDAQITCIPITVNPLPIGDISPTTAVAAICEDNIYQVDFTATVGTGPYDLVINGFTFSGVVSGETIDLMEGVHFTGSMASIDLTAITDTGVTPNCTTTGAPITNLVSPTLNTFTMRGTLTADETICSGDTPVNITGSVSTSSSSVSYGWESSSDNGNNWNVIGGESGKDYSPVVLTQDRWYRRIDTLNTAGALCWTPIDTVVITVNNITISNILGADKVVCEGEIPSTIMGTPSTADGTLTYGWQSSEPLGAWQPVVGATGVTYTLLGPITEHVWYRRVDTSEVNGVKCFQIVDTVQIFLNNFTMVGAITMADTTICPNETPAFISGGNSYGTGAGVGVGATYGWQFMQNGTGWSDLPLETNNDYTPSMPIFMDTWYRRIDTIDFMGTQCNMVVDTIKYIVNNITTAGILSADQAICDGDMPSTINGSASSGDGAISYGWESTTDAATWNSLAGQVGANLTPGAIVVDTWYRRIDTTNLVGIKCTQIVDTVKVFVNSFTTIGLLNNLDETICSGEIPTVITGTASMATGTVSYEWQSYMNGGTWTKINVPSDVDFSPTAITEDTWYRRIDTSEVSGFKCVEIVDTVKVTVNNFTTLGTLSADTTICEGVIPNEIKGTASIGDGPTSYTWQDSTIGSNFTTIVNANSADYTPPALTEDTWYRRIDTANLGGIQCWTIVDTIKITVNNIAISNVLSGDQTICVDSLPSPIIGVASIADGTQTYGWESSVDSGAIWTVILGAVDTSYTPITPISKHTWFRRIDTSEVNGVKCFVEIDTVKVLLNNFTVFGGLDNLDEIVCEGYTATAITGTGSMGGDLVVTYGWEETSDDGVTWNLIPSEIGIDYTPMVSLTSNTWYRRIDTTSLNGVKCFHAIDTVKVTVNNFTTVETLMNVDETICVGEQPNNIFGDPSVADGVISFGWQLSTDSATWTTINGATSAFYIPPGGIYTTTWYQRIDTSTLGSNQCIAIIDTVKVTVNNFDGLGALINPDTIICSGETPFNIEGIASTGTGNITYGWESSIDSGANWLPIIGETTIDYQSGPLVADIWFRRLDTITTAGIACEVIVDTVKIAVNNFITIGTIAADETVCEGATPSMIMGTASMVDGAISHGWEASTLGAGVGFTPIASATGLTYSPPVLTQDTWYRRADTTTLGTSQCIEIIGPIKITVNNIIISTVLNADQTICEAEIPNPITGIPSSSEGTQTYSWESTIDSGMIWTTIVGAIDTSYTPMLPINTNTWYRRIDTSNLGGFKCALPMDTVVVNVNPKPDPIIGGLAVTEICVNDAINLPFSILGIGTYTDTTWLTSDVTRATVTADGLITAIASGSSIISAVVTDANGCKDTSNTHIVVILPLPVAGAITGPNQVCMGDSITLTANPTGGNGVNTISWAVANGTGSATISAAGVLHPMSAGTVDVSYAVADNKTCSAISAFFTVTIDTIPTPIIMTTDTTICQGDMVEFMASGGDSYKFLVNNTPQGAASATATFSTNTLNHNDIVRVVVANSTGCFDTSSVITMIVDTIPLATLISDAPNNTKGIGQAVTFTANGGTNYEFFVNNVSQGIASATTTFTTSTLSHLDTVMVNVADGNTCSDTARIVMNINDRPVALNDTIILLEDALFDTIDVQANDTDPEGDLLTTIIVTGAVHGVNATVNDSTIQYMPDADFNGLDSIEYWVCDDFNNCDAAKIYITVKSVNDIPMANSDTLRITEDDPTSLIAALANDIDVDGDSLNVTILTVPSKGFATVIPDSTVAYTPMPDSSGIDVIAYKVCDTKDSCSVGIIFIEITPVNDRPDAVKDSITIQEDSMNVSVLILANDTDADNDVLTIDTIYPPTSGGTILVSNDTVLYNPPANFNGLDSIKYAICDTALCDTTYLIINVLPVNEAPIAVNDTITIPEDTSTIKIAFLANDLELDGETIILDSLFSASLGTTAVVNDTLCYTPLANANGVDTLKYIITDGLFKDSAYILVNILSINDAPIAVSDTIQIPEDANPGVILVQLNDSDPDGDSFITEIVNGPTNGSAVAAVGAILYTPPASFNGLDTIEYRICDIQVPALCDTAFAFINVTGVNDAPVAMNDTICIAEDTLLAIAVKLNDFDIDGDVTTISILTAPRHASIDSIRNDSIIYQPTANFNGLDSIRYQLFDGSLVDQAWVYITIKPRNDAPISIADTLTILEDMANVQIAVTANDSDIDVGDTLVVTVLNPPTSGGTAIVMNDTTLVYTPGLNFFGLDTIIYQVCDTSNACAIDTVFITVQSVNEPPIAVDDFLTINEDASSVVIDVQANDADGDGDTFTTTIISTPMMADTLNGDSIMVTAPTDFTGVQVVVYKICDALGLCDTGIVTITILPINDAPVAMIDNVVIPQDTTNVAIAPLINDEDVDDVTLTITTVSNPTTANGVATIIGTDSINYTPLAGFNGIDTIHYTVCDTSNLCDNGIIIVTIGFVNTPPNAINDALTGIAEDSGPTIINVLLNDADIDGLADSLKLTTITTPVNGGTATITADSTISYTPPLNFNGIDSLEYTVCDTSMGCATAWVFFTVTSVNDAPYAVNDTVFLSKDTTSAQIVVLTNDGDLEGDALTVTTIGNSTQGVTTTVTGNLIVYSAPTGFLGIDTIRYKVTDIGGLMDTALLIIVITDPNNIPPIANPDVATTIPGIAVNIDVQDNDLEPNGDDLITTIIGGPKAGNTAIVLNQDSIQYTPAITFAGFDTIWYQVCDPSLTCDTSMVIITVENTLAISARVILEGAYDRTTLLMHDSLRKLNLLPVIEPYSTLPRLAGAYEFAHKNGGGNEIITNPGTVLGVTGPNAIVDWVYLELLTTADTIPVASRSALIQRDGDIVEVDGVSPVTFEKLPNGNYFLSIRHRNHLGVMTKTAQPFAQSTFSTLDFTIQGAGSTPAFGTHAMDTVQSRLVLWAGDGNADRKIIYDGIANDRDPVFFDVITDPLNINSNYNHVTFGYYRGDYDMKGSAVYLGGGNDPDVIFFNVFLHPNNAVGSTIFIISEQIPR